LPDEVKSEFRSAAASRLIGYENVNLRILPVAHVVNEVDLGSHEIEIAEIAIKKDAEPNGWRSRILSRWLLSLRRRENDGH
jgi:hypothetical protein